MRVIVVFVVICGVIALYTSEGNTIKKKILDIAGAIAVGILTSIIWLGVEEIMDKKEVTSSAGVMETPATTLAMSSTIKPTAKPTELPSEGIYIPQSTEMVTTSEPTPIYDEYIIEKYEEKRYEIIPYSEYEINNTNVIFLNYAGIITSEEQEDIYEFVAPESGEYRYELTNTLNGFRVSIYVYDMEGGCLDYIIGASSGKGITVSLLKGESYRLVVKSHSNTGNYNVCVGQAKESVNISNYTIVKDSIEFIEQENIYVYTSTVTGAYRFWISQANSGMRVSLYIYDEAGYVEEYVVNIGQDGGVDVTLEAGHTYTIKVVQYSDYGNYSMSIGLQKATVDISGYVVITDSMQFMNQENKYVYTPTITRTYRFWISQANSGMRVSLYIYDEAGYVEEYVINIGQDSGIEVMLDEGQTYLILIKQYSGYDVYSFSVE